MTLYEVIGLLLPDVGDESGLSAVLGAPWVPAVLLSTLVMV